MIDGKTVLAIIPARAGSKGLPGKNIKILAGKPLIAWSIAHGIQSKYVDKVIVSTDSREIASVAREHGASVPFQRPDELSNDEATTIDVILHAIEYYKRLNTPYDIIVLLEPTSPLRESIDIDNSLEMLINDKSAESVVGISKVEDRHPAFLVSLENKFLRSYLDEDFKVSRRQDVRELYFYEGSIYSSYVASLIDRKNFYHSQTLGYVVPKWKSFEIDDQIDFTIVESLLKSKLNSRSEGRGK